MATNIQALSTCPECGSADVVRGVTINQTAETGRIGLSYRKEGILGIPLVGTAPLLADVCNSCGVVVRLRVESAGKDWIQRNPPV
jgi:predicted RNA-binding Zn-ribbon protein involved in translation (DUF1610 family)